MGGYPFYLPLVLGGLAYLALGLWALGLVPAWPGQGLALLYGASAFLFWRSPQAFLLILSGLLGLLNPWPWGGLLFFLTPMAAFFSLRRVREKEEAAFHGWLFVWPSLLLLLAWQVFPALFAFWLSLLDRFNFLGETRFFGLGNYAILLKDPLFHRALGNTFWFVVFTVPTGLFLAFWLAVLLNERIAFRGLYRTLIFLPYITALTAAAAVWRWIYHPEFGFLNWLLHTPGLDWLNTPSGLFTYLLKPLGLEVQGFWAGPSLAFTAVMVVSVWHFLGYQTVILLAGLQNIPKEYYEAAALDGASWWQMHRHITWPLLSPTTFFLFTLGLIGAFQVFTQVYVLTPTGGVLQDTLTLAMYLYNKGFRDSDFSYASALAMVTFLLILMVTIVQRRILEKRVNYEA
ncbi:MAG: sugar ABC transporter permease [Thermus sp.]